MGFPLESGDMQGGRAEWHLLKGFGSSPPPVSGFIEERCFRADGFIIRTKATIRTNGFFVGAGFLAALPRANRVLIRINTIRIKTWFLNKAQPVYALS